MHAPRFLRSRLFPARLSALALALVASAPAAALEHGAYSLEVLVGGRSLPELSARGTTYVEALEGAEYALRLSNHTGGRIAVALSVDGLNTIDARTSTAREAAKWILGPYETITLHGWQTGTSTARRFFFTTEERSYGAWLGRTANLGVVSAAVFREKPRRQVPIHAPRPERLPGRSSREEGEAPRPPASALPQEAPRESEGRLEARSGVAGGEAAAPEPADDLAATGIGGEIEHRVRRVRFETEATPVAVLDIRYEYRDALVRLGVLPRPFGLREDPLARRECARGFEEPRFAPDPFR